MHNGAHSLEARDLWHVLGKGGTPSLLTTVCSPGRGPGSLLPSVCRRLQNGGTWGAFSLGSRLHPNCVFLGQGLVVETPWAPSSLVGLPENPHHVPPAQQTPQGQPDSISVCDSAHHRLPKSPATRVSQGQQEDHGDFPADPGSAANNAPLGPRLPRGVASAWARRCPWTELVSTGREAACRSLPSWGAHTAVGPAPLYCPGEPFPGVVSV